MNKHILFSLIIFCLICTILLYFFQTYENYTSSFPITTDYKLYPKVGKFNDEHLIKSYGTNNLKACQRYCNLLEACEGISYRKDLDLKKKECRLYNYASLTEFEENPFYLSWKKFFSHMY